MKSQELCVLKGNGHKIDSIRKRLIQIFKGHDLTIDDICTRKRVDYLDIVLNLEDGS